MKDIKQFSKKRTSFGQLFADVEASPISPEQKRAMIIMLEALPLRRKYAKTNLSVEDVCTQGNFFFTTSSLFPPHIPHGKEWAWNQSRTKLEFKLGNILEGTLRKLNVRGKNGSIIPFANCKIWTFDIVLGDREDTSFFWCEKGLSSKSSSCRSSREHALPVRTHSHGREILGPHLNSNQPIATCEGDFFPSEDQETPEITLADLSFLKEFVRPITAREFGWV